MDLSGVIGAIIAIVIGFAFISEGLSIIGLNFTIGLGCIVAGVVAIIAGVKIAL
jgi:hypothetical protein